MAALIPDGTSSYYQHFASGNAIEGEGSPFITYAANFDTNFVLLRNTLNTLIGEFNAVAGTNQALPLDVFLLDDPDGVGVETGGVIGAHSYEVSHDSADTVTVQSGTAIVSRSRVELAVDATMPGGALANGTWWVALDTVGNLSFEAGADQQALDIASLVRSGGAFTGAVTQLADIIHDQDAWQAILTRPNSDSSPNDAFPVKVFRTPEPRFRAIERLLSGFLTDDDGDPIGPLIAADGAAGTPSIQNRDDDAGFSFASGIVQTNTNGTGRIRVVDQGLLVMVRGTNANPAIAYSGDLNTGFVWPSSVAIHAVVDGVVGLEVNAQRQVNMPEQFRVRSRSGPSGQTIADATLEPIDFDTEDYDVGGWHDVVSPTSAHVVPANGDGLYFLAIGYEYDTSATTGNNSFRMRLLLNGASVIDLDTRANPNNQDEITRAAADMVELDAGDELTAEAASSAGPIQGFFRITAVRINEQA